MVIAICEAKLKTSKERSLKEYDLPNFDMHEANLENSIGRGIVVYTHKCIGKSTIQVTHSSNFEEACLLEIRLRGGDILLFGCCYRSPTESDTSSINNKNLNKLLEYVSLKRYSHVCIVGDFNFKSINWTSGTTSRTETSEEHKFLETIRDCFLYQQVQEPTRKRGNDTPSLLDLILTNEALQVSEIKHLPPLGKSDHDMLVFEFNCYLDYTKSKERYIFSKGDYINMRKYLSESNWAIEFENLSTNHSTEPNELWNSLKNMIHDLRNKFVPLEPASRKNSWKSKGNVPLDEAARKAIKLKEKSHRDWMKAIKLGRYTQGKALFTKARNKVKSLLRKAKRKFERGIALEAKTNPKSFWSHTRRHLKTKSGIAPLLENQMDHSSMKFDDQSKVEILSKQYSSVFTKEDMNNIPTIEDRSNKLIKDLVITVEMVTKALHEINPNKSCGPDLIHPRLLIELADQIAEPITVLFNKTVQSGILPTDWKRAFISPIYKKGSRHLAENYRPISLTSIISKIIEKLVRDRVVKHLLAEKLLSDKQYGFITGRSTTTQILYYLDNCIKEISSGGVIDAIYLDFSKAFDTVPHQRLLRKLEAYGIQGNILNWIKAFLIGRTQEVTINGTISEAVSVLSGIPQGTVLGPVLFIIYINDLLENISSTGLMFADDTKIFRLITSRNDSLVLQSDIKKLEEWSLNWQLRFNPDKCHILSLGKFDNIKYAHSYNVYGNEIDHVFEEKDLGIIIDSELRFEEHIGKKIRVANALVGQIRRSFSYLDCDTFRRIYAAFVRPHLEYGQAIWSPFRMKYIRAIENVQIRATKLVDGLGNTDYENRLKRLNLPTLAFRRKRGDMIEIYKHFKTYDKSTLSSSFMPRQRISRKHQFQLHIPPTNDGKLGIQTNFFYNRVVKTWNDLPAIVVSADNTNTFKNRLDKYWENNSLKFDFSSINPTDE